MIKNFKYFTLNILVGSGSGLTPLSQRSWNDCHKKGFKYRAFRQASAAKCDLSERHQM